MSTFHTASLCWVWGHMKEANPHSSPCGVHILMADLTNQSLATLPCTPLHWWGSFAGGAERTIRAKGRDLAPSGGQGRPWARAIWANFKISYLSGRVKQKEVSLCCIISILMNFHYLHKVTNSEVYHWMVNEFNWWIRRKTDLSQWVVLVPELGALWQKQYGFRVLVMLNLWFCKTPYSVWSSLTLILLLSLLYWT